jgi:4-amino-4-deoxyprephenate dehydrogenase
MNVVVAGAAGGFGRIFVDLLSGPGCRVLAVDSTAASRPDVVAADVVHPSDELTAELGRADLLVLCLPERALFPALPGLLGALPAGALVVDVTSVKARYAEQALRLRDDIELCSLEPLFAPDVGFAGQQVLVAELRGGPATGQFRRLLGHTGAVVRTTTVDAIDRQAAATQVAAHAALLAYGDALAALDPALAGAETALQRALVSLLARIATRDPAVYWHIQRDNPYAAEARDRLRSGLDRLSAAVEADDMAAFAALVGRGGAALGDRLTDLAGRSAGVVAAAGYEVPDASAERPAGGVAAAGPEVPDVPA